METTEIKKYIYNNSETKIDGRAQQYTGDNRVE